MDDYKFLFKVVLVGNAGVGKTCLVRRFTQGLFPPGQGATIGVDFMIKTVDVDNEKVKVMGPLTTHFHTLTLVLQLQIWDTAGQERFRSITQSYYRSAHALILVYDISCQPTFDCLPDWLREIEEYASSKVLRVLVGNVGGESRERRVNVVLQGTRLTGRTGRSLLTWGRSSPSGTTCTSWRRRPKRPRMWSGSSCRSPRT
jgi:small GTP-binding protein